MRAYLKNYHQTPRKTRLVTDLVKGKRVPEALMLLTHLNKKAAEPIKKLIESAVANAKVQGERVENLTIKNFTVDKGLVMTRFLPRARGSASPLRKRMSHLLVELSSGAVREKAVKPAKAERAPKAKKPVAKKKTTKTA
jgi:large subunit ribosomal protein L22